MYIQEISIDIRTKSDRDELIDECGLLMAFYRGNGQTQGRIENQYIENSKIVCLPYTLEENSLDKKLNNFYVNRQIEKLQVLCNSILTFRTVGKSYDSYQVPCTCKKFDLYILSTNYITIDSPVTCGTCNKSVPLYRLPEYYDYGNMPILS